MIYERMLAEKERLQTQINSLQAQLAELPDGKLICSRNGNYYKWYINNKQMRSYLPKKERQLAQKLALKNYLSLQLADLLQEQKAIDSYLRHHNCNTTQTLHFLDNPAYIELLSKHFAPLSDELLTWATSPYVKNENFSEQLIHKSTSGNFVRSKSEAIIDMFLYLNKIPFRYECALLLGNTTIFPDFTIRHPKTGEYFYWEHFGLMNNPQYCKNMHSKLQLYTSYDIIPSINLITTYETQNHPLSPELIELLIKYYFL